MKKTQFFKYVKKLLPIIIVLCFVATLAIYLKLSRSNAYIASEVIHYNDERAEQGLAPTGERLDVNEIKSSAVMSKVVDRMGLTGVYSVDNLISRINITPIEDKDKVAQKEAKLEEGEEYVYEPDTYIVSFAATSGEGAEFARTILDETLDVYFSQFSQKYVNVAPANNTIEKIQNGNYDYIEIMELIDTAIEEALNTLYQRMDKNYYYRATSTGESFSDLAEDFNYLRQVNVSSLFSKIYKHQITKSKPILVSDYTTRIDNNNISNEKEVGIIEDIVTVIDAYVDKMRASGNTNISYEYILDDVHERNVQDYFGDQTVTYDELIYEWRNHNESKEHAIIDSAYCRYVIDSFEKCTGLCENAECALSDLTCTQLNSPDYEKVRSQVDNEIASLVDSLTNLYNVTMQTNEEYNEYLGASYISVLASTSVRESINVTLYTIIAFVFLVVVCCTCAVVLGRTGDIINYVFYTDHLTSLNNRAYFDRYLKSMDKKILDHGVVYCMVEIANLAFINSEHTREVGDSIIKMFTAYLKEAFGKAKADFIYNGNGSFIILVEDSDYITVEDIIRLFRLRLDDREEYGTIVIEYNIGIAETFEENKTARKLLAEAIKSRKTYASQVK